MNGKVGNYSARKGYREFLEGNADAEFKAIIPASGQAVLALRNAITKCLFCLTPQGERRQRFEGEEFWLLWRPIESLSRYISSFLNLPRDDRKITSEFSTVIALINS